MYYSLYFDLLFLTSFLLRFQTHSVNAAVTGSRVHVISRSTNRDSSETVGVKCQNGCTPLMDLCVCPPSTVPNLNNDQSRLENAYKHSTEKHLPKINGCKCRRTTDRTMCNYCDTVQLINSDNSNICQNGGFDNLLGGCQCVNGYTGDYCQYAQKLFRNHQSKKEEARHFAVLCKFLLGHRIFNKKQSIIEMCDDL